MKQVKINLISSSYEIQIGPGLLDQVPARLVALGFEGRTVIVTNPDVGRLYGDTLKTNLENTGYQTVLLEVPDGESYKSLEQAGRLYLQLSEIQAERNTPILALGGGVIGDLTGFVAATYMRGAPLIHLPTTLLAQVDSSLGGKTAVNHAGLKNQIGVFYQPRLVVSDIRTLVTLPDAELMNGLAEVIKYGIIRDKVLFALIENSLTEINSLHLGLIEELVERSARIKAEIVEQDERDMGLRNILNFGHTIGHAVETASDFTWSHGQAVAVGMVAAALISYRMGVLPGLDTTSIISLIEKAGLPIKTKNLDTVKIMQALQHDKKKSNGQIRFILPKCLGEVFIQNEVSPALIEQVLRDLNE
jgi:3-dehydroquinate synthase